MKKHYYVLNALGQVNLGWLSIGRWHKGLSIVCKGSDYIGMYACVCLQTDGDTSLMCLHWRNLVFYFHLVSIPITQFGLVYIKTTQPYSFLNIKNYPHPKTTPITHHCYGKTKEKGSEACKSYSPWTSYGTWHWWRKHSFEYSVQDNGECCSKHCKHSKK